MTKKTWSKIKVQTFRSIQFYSGHHKAPTTTEAGQRARGELRASARAHKILKSKQINNNRVFDWLTKRGKNGGRIVIVNSRVENMISEDHLRVSHCGAEGGRILLFS